jgi:zinc transporter
VTKPKPRFAFALLLDGKGGARELSEDEVDRWSPEDGLLWLDIDQNVKRARQWLAQTSGLSQIASSILLAGETRPRTVVEEDGLIVIMRGINMNPGAVPDDMVAVRVWLDLHRIVTSRRRRILSVLDIRETLLAGTGPKTAGGFLVALTGFLAGRIAAAVENIETMLDGVDDNLSSGRVAEVRADLSVVRRQAAAMRRHLTPQRDALDRLARLGGDLLSPAEVFDLREEGDHLTRHIEDLDLARENALVTQEELMNRIAQEQNARMYLLSVVAAIFLPLTFVTGLLGMNVAGLPGTENPQGFFISALVMIGLGLGLAAYFKWRRWI